MTARGRGRDELSETKGSLPSHSRSGCPAGHLRVAGQVRSKGGAADEAAARRTMTGLPFSECESGRLREAPIPEPSAFGREEPDQARHRTFGFKDLPRRKAGFRSARRHRRKRASARIGRAGPGFGPGAANRRTQRFGAWTVRRNQGLRPEDPAGCGDGGFGFRNREGRNEKRKLFDPPRGEPSGLRPCRGACGETGSGFGRGRTPEGAMDEPPAHSSFLETARNMERLASQARFKCEGTVGAGSNAGPHYFARSRR